MHSKLNVVEGKNTFILSFTTSVLVYNVECEKSNFKHNWMYIIKYIIKILNIYKYKITPDLYKRSKIIESILETIINECKYNLIGDKKDELSIDNSYFIINNMEVYLDSVSNYVDSAIFITVKLLNSNNHKTIYSCSSHMYNNHWYIMFEYSERTLNMLYDMYESLREIKDVSIKMVIDVWNGLKRIILYIYRHDDINTILDINCLNNTIFGKFADYIGSKDADTSSIKIRKNISNKKRI